jgi:hypothetical protein
MVNLIFDDAEAQVLRALLVDKTNLPTMYRHSPTQQAYRSMLGKLDTAKDKAPRSPSRLSALEKLTAAVEEEPRPKGRRVKNPA